MEFRAHLCYLNRWHQTRDMSDSILIVAAGDALIRSITDKLSQEGFSVSSKPDGIRGEREIRRNHHDLIILDAELPGESGYEICRTLRKDGFRTPILMISDKASSIDTVNGLRTGADDVLSNPPDMAVLLARVEALLRRSRHPRESNTREGQRLRFGEFVLDTYRRELYQDGKAVDLKSQEYKLIAFFSENPDRAIDRDELLEAVWGYGDAGGTRTVDMHVARLRRKLNEKGTPRFIHTKRGYGYRFTPNGTR